MKSDKLAGSIIPIILIFTFLLVCDELSHYWQYADELGVALLVSVVADTLSENNNKK